MQNHFFGNTLWVGENRKIEILPILIHGIPNHQHRRFRVTKRENSFHVSTVNKIVETTAQAPVPENTDGNLKRHHLEPVMQQAASWSEISLD